MIHTFFNNSARHLAMWTLGLAAALQPNLSFGQTGTLGVHANSNGMEAGSLDNKPTSRDVQRLTNWITHSKDNQDLPYIVIDKVGAQVFVFNPEGQLQGVQPALLGMAKGDHTPLGIGKQEIDTIVPKDRTTPAGRFVAMIGKAPGGKDVLWVDQESALALHRIVQGIPGDRRAERLESATSKDNRISFGCINVSKAFYETVVSSVFGAKGGIVYILPEVKTVKEVFGVDLQ